MKRLSLLLALIWSSAASAGVINVEFKFTPFTGDPATADQVETVPGKAMVFMNGVPIADQEIRQEELPVLFEEREIAPSVWIPTESLGPALRKGKNTIRIEFVPDDLKAKYRAQLRWASVMDEETETSDDGKTTSTNQAGEGVEDKSGAGKLVFEKEFTADFAADQPWHHYPPVTALSAADKAGLLKMVKDRAGAFKPDFAGVYELLKKNEKIDLDAVRKNKCLETGYAAGIRIAAAPEDQIEIVTTGNAEVVIRSKEGMLFFPEDPSVFEKIKDEDVQMCVGMTLFGVYPPRLIVVRGPSGAWEVAY